MCSLARHFTSMEPLSTQKYINRWRKPVDWNNLKKWGWPWIGLVSCPGGQCGQKSAYVQALKWLGGLLSGCLISILVTLVSHGVLKALAGWAIWPVSWGNHFPFSLQDFFIFRYNTHLILVMHLSSTVGCLSRSGFRLWCQLMIKLYMFQPDTTMAMC